MAQTIQIVPQYLHSHVETYINDYTAFEDTTQVVSDDSVKFLAVFMGPQGIDNTLVKIEDLETFTNIFGKPNYALYGQPMMMPVAELSTGNASCWCMRVMPTDATYSSSVLSVYYKADVENKKFRIKFKAKSFIDASAVTSKEDLLTKGQTLDGDADPGSGLYTDGEGYTQLPMVTFRAMGRGLYGNNLRWRIARNKDYEADYEIKMYSFETLNASNGIKKIATYVGSMVDSTKYTETVLINDIVDDADTGVPPMDVQAYEDNFEALYEAYVQFLKDVAEANPEETITIPDNDQFDPFFALGVANDVNDPYISFTKMKDGSEAEAEDENDYSDDTDLIQIDNVEGTSLAGGGDGAFANEDAESKDAAIEAAYINAFNGTADPIILANKRTQCDAILDANYPYEVKKVLADLAIARNDCLCFLDCGFVQSFSTANQSKLLEEYSIFNTRGLSKNPQWYTIKDPTTKKKIPVTVTYFFAQNYANHIVENGNHVPFVNSYCQLSGHVKNSLQPCIDEHEMDLKEWLYVNRFNYFEAIGENQFQRCCQNTAQAENSDLMEENNMAVLFEMKHILEVDARENLYNFANADDRKRFTEYEQAKFAPWVGRKLYSFNISFEMNEWEAERSILHCYVAVQFRTLNKRTIIEIDVNKRDFTA